MATKTIVRLADQASGFLTNSSASSTYATKAELSTTNSELDSLESTVGSLPSIPIGVIMPFAGASNAPYGWEFCYGQELSISAYGGLYNTLTGSGTSFPYGANTNGSGGAGSTHFRVPDFRGRIPAGLDNMGGSAAGRLTTLSSSAIGATGGSQTVTTSNHSHNHISPIGLNSGQIMSINPGDGQLDLLGSYNIYDIQTSTAIRYEGTTGTAAYERWYVTSSANGSETLNNLPPTIAIKYIIKY